MSFQRGIFHTYVVTVNVLHATLGESKTPYTFRAGDVLSYDGTAVDTPDGNRYTCLELKGAIKNSWIKRIGDTSNELSSPPVHHIRPANMEAHGTNRFVPKIENMDTTTVGTKSDQLMLGILRDFQSELLGAPDSKGVVAKAEVRPQYITTTYEGEGKTVAEISNGTTSFRGMAYDNSNNVVRDISGLSPTTPQNAVIQNNARTANYSTHTEHGEVRTFSTNVEKPKTLEESSRAQVSGASNISSPPKVSVGAAVQQDGMVKTQDSNGYRIQGLLKTPTQSTSVVGEASNSVGAEENRLAKMANDGRSTFRRTSAESKTEVYSSKLDSPVAQETSPQEKEPVHTDELRYDIVKIFIPDFAWDKSAPKEERLSKIQDILDANPKDLRLKGILAVEDSDIKHQVVVMARKRLRKKAL